jgi:tRNA pseudouridine32 synthase/23S rRNA pseudouridine746 synthase
MILHVDDALIVAEKPAGLLAVPGRRPDKQDCLSARIQQRSPDALIVHRLDMDTSGISGILCFARTAEAQRRLNRAFEERRVGKRYCARVIGRLEGAGEIDLPLSVDWENRPKSKLDPVHGRPSSHQLRVHMAALGHPVEFFSPPPF